MKVRTITCHDVYNFGASLQAYALQHYLEEQGNDVRIINYKPDYLSHHFRLGHIANPKFNRPLLKQLYLLAKLPGRLKSFSRKHAFDRFTNKYLHLTRRYNSYEELKADPPEADLYIAGSDQIWNTIFRNGRDAAFYLDFGKQTAKRISYAASFATSDVIDDYRDFVKSELKNFDAISIRERTSLPLLNSLGRDGQAVCDPVLLLEKPEWESLLKNNPLPHKVSEIIKRPFILLYPTDYSESMDQIALKIKKCTGWNIISVGPIKTNSTNIKISNIGPTEFLHLINEASFVISNSFHATVFALIFEKRFCTVNRKEGINERMRSLLQEFGLQSRLVSDFDKQLLDPINFNDVKTNIEKSVEESKSWLQDEMSGLTSNLLIRR
ncbi:MAG: polysaccharide pyruvyl transferase family protein [Bacteroides sp.]|nr:polysaccharide pyruvyl transferase family protein [Bacteroides sp.]